MQRWRAWLKRAAQGTCPIWPQYSSSYTRFRRRGHVEVRLILAREVLAVKRDFFFRYLIQDASTLCRCLRNPLPRPLLPLRLRLQFDHENLLHRKLRLHPLPHEVPLPVRPSPHTHHRRASDITPTPSPTQDPSLDTFRVEYLVGPCAVLALIFNYNFTFVEVLWSFSIFFESVAIIPQLFMLQRTGEAETITTHYLAALGGVLHEYL